ncbi:hypothetical protein RUND412_010306 [Rhizina undulata]
MPWVPVYSRDLNGVLRDRPLRNNVPPKPEYSPFGEPVTHHYSKETRSTAQIQDAYIKKLESRLEKKNVAIKCYQEDIASLENKLSEKDLALRDQQSNSEFQRRVLQIIQWPYDTNSPISQDDICGHINDLRNTAILLEKNVKAYNDNLKKEKRRVNDLLQKHQQVNEAYEELLREYQENRRISDERVFRVEEKYRLEMLRKEEGHEAELMNLKREHFRTVREMDWGVESMNDDSIANRFTALRDYVADWTRISFKHWSRMTSLEFPREVMVSQLFSRNALRDGKLSTPEIVQAVLWGILETHVFQPWLFGLEDDLENAMKKMENSVETLEPAITQEWRVYNIMRLRNAPQIKHHRESRIDQIVDMTLSILSSVVEPRDDKISPAARRQKLRLIVSSAAELATELKTQKAVFEIDQSVEPDVAYDPEAMSEIQFKEEPEELQARRAMVSCVISRGWIKKGGGGNMDDWCRICLGMVKVL